MTNSMPEPDLEGIAIVGMAGRFPKSGNIREYWENLQAGRECLTEFHEDEVVAAGVPRSSLAEKRVRNRGVLDGAECFDPAFFGYSPREADIMDPQQRVFLETAWEALEDAGYDSERPPGPIGVFAGSGINTYFSANVRTHPEILESFGMFPAVVLNEKDFIATRVAYAMDLRGPAMSIQTACSTSLVAICSACQCLLNFECDAALAGAAAAVFPQCHSSIHEEGGMIAPDGRCRPFDEHASGTLFSDGVGVVVLRRLSDALEAGDHVRAVIKGFAVNNDGAGKAGFTAPSVDGQAEVIQAAQEFAGVAPDSISYIEAHGTATPLGDPIEIAALTQAFRKGTDKKRFCGIGSVKSNLGHLDVAAGVAGLIKATLALENRAIPQTLHVDQPRSKIDWESSPFYVVDRPLEWKAGPTPRRAGVSSFGIGGTNAHVVLEEAPTRQPSPRDTRNAHLLVLSAKTATALDAATANLAAQLKHGGNLEHGQELNLADVAFTLQTGRRAFHHRRAVVCEDVADAVATLEAGSSRRVATNAIERLRRPVAFLFSGQGSQYVDMGLGLYEREAVFREHVDRCADILQPHLERDLRDVLYPRPADREQAAELLRQTAFTQPALFVVEYALAMLWRSWGLRPGTMVGHSTGEYVAACLADVFTLEGALALVAARGRLMQGLPSGSMLAVPFPEAEILPRLDERCCIGVINSPSMCVVSGENEAVEELERTLAEEGVQSRRLQTSHAFHSPMMEPILETFKDEVRRQQPRPPQIAFVSNVTGDWITPEQAADPDYWAQHLRQTVRFSDCLTTLLAKDDSALLEVGPGKTLASLSKMHPDADSDRPVLATTRQPEEKRSDTVCALDAAGRLWVSGVDLDWAGLHADRERRRVPLPTYPFERQRHWIEPARQPQQAAVETQAAPIAQAAPSAAVLAPQQSQQPHQSKEAPQSQQAPLAGDDGAPRDAVEREIAAIWHELLGGDRIRIDESFFDLGGTSLSAARMFALIHKRCGPQLPLSTLINAPTIAGLADVVRGGEREASALVEIQRGAEGVPPLFLIHAEGGHVLMYCGLAGHLGADCPVYGLQSRGLDGATEPSNNIEEMAQRYVAEIRRVQPHGPYYLGGWCLGGSIGYEMAQQFEAAGESVAWLAIIQARHPSYWQYQEGAGKLRRLAWKAADRLSFEVDSVARSRRDGGLTNLWQRTQRLAARAGAAYGIGAERSASVAATVRANAVAEAHLEAYWAYDPRPYGGRVILLRSSNQPHGIRPDPTLGWNDLLEGPLEVYEIPSHHANILSGAQAAMVGKVLRKSLDRARRPAASPAS